ncbi:unnamed protein product (macronuclear) [Paramecium tetraurelia]|uniref:Casein kinase I n=1 Tax=Paramecium tetraurelia TaxID=5888 RepID=A0EEQ4_PARTE|nr:uncharacterized protein GSPATT00026117001 [Paramecium tetraurelia]CAK93795.1 unnamed protein product [Paramecium tetraurelia]|eukprot:XP_001461168.1 hypothetical protein (macronuclear) [Paramecium tetraurelia strain d4-2]
MYELQLGDLIGNVYKVKKLLSQGSFGRVYLGRNIESGMKVAIKVEKQEIKRGQLRHYQQVKILKKLRGISQVPQLLWHGKHNEFQVMITKMLGFDLIYFLKKHKRFSNECIFNIAQQMIEILENIHKKNILHRDLKPENILGKRHSDQIYLIDYGIAKDFVKSKKQSQVKIPFIGTSRYASITAHQGLEQSRRDDLESLGYVLIYLFKQKLPWSNYENSEYDRLERIGQLKSEIPLKEICEGCPQQLYNYMIQVAELNHQQVPNYQKLKSIFQSKINHKQHVIFDWSNTQLANSKSSQDRTKNNLKQNKYDSVQQIKLSIEKMSSRHLHTITFHVDSNASSCFNSQQSSSMQHSFGSHQSVQVDFMNSDSSEHTQKQEINKISTFEAFLITDDIMPIKDQLQLMELENQDLEIKHTLLHYHSVYYNFKNPFQSLLQLRMN